MSIVKQDKCLVYSCRSTEVRQKIQTYLERIDTYTIYVRYIDPQILIKICNRSIIFESKRLNTKGKQLMITYYKY